MTQADLTALALILYKDGYHDGIALAIAKRFSSVYPDLDYARFLVGCGLEAGSRAGVPYTKKG